VGTCVVLTVVKLQQAIYEGVGGMACVVTSPFKVVVPMQFSATQIEHLAHTIQDIIVTKVIITTRDSTKGNRS
jgi:hypothetical protein